MRNGRLAQAVRRRWRQTSWRRLVLISRLEPISRLFGFDRGTPIDRYYIGNFIERNAADIRGTVLEIGERSYTVRYGGTAVKKSEVLHAVEGNQAATIIGDLTTGSGVPGNTFDCIILTQTLPFLYEPREALGHCLRALKSSGVVLATLPGISQISRYDMDRWGDFWRFTDASARRLFEEVFGVESVQVETHGNVLAACAFLQGFAAEELKAFELDYHDPDYQLLITVRAQKPHR